jgi:glucose/arabinose dehydrogenase
VNGTLDVANAQTILQVPQPYSNHNGGELAFGSDGYLYLSLGDGGGGGDPEETGQDNTDLLGSVLRLDVSGAGYTSPPTNPFFGSTPGRDEVWAYGFRNPWRFSFDSVAGDLWLADVGQGSWEEVDLVTSGGNYGWDCYEGFVSYEPAGCSPSGKIPPEHVYSHADGACAVTGGFVYRGAQLPELWGWYVYGDFCNGRIWALDTDGSGGNVLLLDTGYLIPSFGQLADGEIVVVTYSDGVFRLTRD